MRVIMRCTECGEDGTHKALCLTWLKERLDPLLAKHPKLKFQLTKLSILPTQGSYPVYIGYLCAPFVYESGSALTNDLRRDMADARVPITMTKAEMNNPERDRIFKEKRIGATHLLIDIIESNKIPRGQDRWSEATYWGTLADLFPEEY